jgi:AbrB family looped-hinge helix DNA binding protein
MVPPVRAQVSEKGRLVIPAKFREALGIRPGDFVELHIEDNELRVATLDRRIRETRRRLRKVFGAKRMLSDELIAERREAARGEL